MANDRKATAVPAPNPEPGAAAPGPSVDRGPAALDRLRGKRDAAAADAAAKNKGGRRPGAAGPAGSRGAPPAAPAPDPQLATLDSLHKKVGMAWRGVMYGAAVATDCSAWLLVPEEERLLGEAYGDLLHELGISDSIGVKCVFLVGVTLGVLGPKAVEYSRFDAQRRSAAAALKKGQPSAPPAERAKAEPAPPAPEQQPAEAPAAPALHESRPGAL